MCHGSGLCSRTKRPDQNIEENYVFDAKILSTIEDEDEIQELALLGVDGVIFPNTIIKINS